MIKTDELSPPPNSKQKRAHRGPWRPSYTAFTNLIVLSLASTRVAGSNGPRAERRAATTSRLGIMPPLSAALQWRTTRVQKRLQCACTNNGHQRAPSIVRAELSLVSVQSPSVCRITVVLQSQAGIVIDIEPTPASTPLRSNLDTATCWVHTDSVPVAS